MGTSFFKGRTMLINPSKKSCKFYHKEGERVLAYYTERRGRGQVWRDWGDKPVNPLT